MSNKFDYYKNIILIIIIHCYASYASIEVIIYTRALVDAKNNAHSNSMLG